VNAANEECVRAFEAGALPFLGIVDTLARVLDEHDRAHGGPSPRNTVTLTDVLATEHWARVRAIELIGHAPAVVADPANAPAARGGSSA
jgi:1-deoxy-D-xylulose-5-phosphate reductoisomerase